MSEKKEYPSMDVTYEWGRTTPEQLSKEADALDTKILGLLAVASLIISVVTGLAEKIRIDATLTPFIIAGVCFALLFAKSLWVLRAYPFRVGDCPKILKEDWWPMEPSQMKEKYWANVEKAFEVNYKGVKAKGRVLQWIVPLLGGEVFCLIIWLFLVALI